MLERTLGSAPSRSVRFSYVCSPGPGCSRHPCQKRTWGRIRIRSNFRTATAGVPKGQSHGGGGYGKSQMQRYPNLPGRELQRAMRSAVTGAWTEFRLWHRDRDRLGMGWGRPGCLRANGGRGRATAEGPGWHYDRVTVKDAIRLAYLWFSSLFTARSTTHTRRELNSPSGDRWRKSLP